MRVDRATGARVVAVRDAQDQQQEAADDDQAGPVPGDLGQHSPWRYPCSRQVETADFCFLFEGGPAVKLVVLGRGCSRLGGADGSFLFRRWSRRLFVGAASASQFMRGRQAARKQLELAETSVPLVCERAGLNGCWRLRMCQHAIKVLRATADLAGFLPARSATCV